MMTRRMRSKDWLALGGTALLVLIALPLLGILAFSARAVALLVVVAAALTVATLYAVPALRGRLGAMAAPELAYRGLRLPGYGFELARSHAWVRASGRKAEIGVDDLVQSTFGPVAEIELPARGELVEQGEPLFRLRNRGRTLAVPSPVTGRVVEANLDLYENPSLLNQDPFVRGWAVRLAGDGAIERRHLMGSERAREWFRGELDRLLGDVFTTPESAPSLPDGGVLVHELWRQVDDTAWQRLKTAYFADAGER
jgi:glycine cleavage system H protein